MKQSLAIFLVLYVNLALVLIAKVPAIFLKAVYLSGATRPNKDP